MRGGFNVSAVDMMLNVKLGPAGDLIRDGFALAPGQIMACAQMRAEAKSTSHGSRTRQI